MCAQTTPSPVERRASDLLACSDGRPVIQIAIDPVTGATTVSSVGIDATEIPHFLSRVADALVTVGPQG